MNKHHEITMKDLEGYTNNILLARSSDEYKELFAHVDINAATVTIKVMSHGEIVYSGNSLEKAIETYNSIY